jgi:hypothetical protein
LATTLMSPALISLCFTMAAYTFLRSARLAAGLCLAAVPAEALTAVAFDAAPPELAPGCAQA